MPTAAEKPKAIIIAVAETRVGQPVINEATVVIPIPRRIPINPPKRESTTASIKN